MCGPAPILAGGMRWGFGREFVAATGDPSGDATDVMCGVRWRAEMRALQSI